VRAQALQIPGGQGQVVFLGQIKDGLEPYAAVQMAVQIYQG
jgi:hypothetical protein